MKTIVVFLCTLLLLTGCASDKAAGQASVSAIQKGENQTIQEQVALIEAMEKSLVGNETLLNTVVTEEMIAQAKKDGLWIGVDYPNGEDLLIGTETQKESVSVIQYLISQEKQWITVDTKENQWVMEIPQDALSFIREQFGISHYAK